jgi:hypothetical protein
MPKRIQLRRSAGWRILENAVKVDRSTKGDILHHIDQLRCHDLARWCPLDQRCHAHVLLQTANASEAQP